MSAGPGLASRSHGRVRGPPWRGLAGFTWLRRGLLSWRGQDAHWESSRGAQYGGPERFSVDTQHSAVSAQNGGDAVGAACRIVPVAGLCPPSDVRPPSPPKCMAGSRLPRDSGGWTCFRDGLRWTHRCHAEGLALRKEPTRPRRGWDRVEGSRHLRLRGRPR